MTALDDAMHEHMAYIVLSLCRPFSFKDFLYFKLGDKEYRLSHGTFRNKILLLKKKQIVELDYNSGIAFYTLKGKKFGKAMTPNRTVVNTDPFYEYVRNLPSDKQSIHDIRIKFRVPSIWTLLSNTHVFNENERSHDIVIGAWIRENTIVKIFIHKTDTVSVILGCSLDPIPLDFNGIIRFFTLLAMIEVKLQSILDNSIPIDYGKQVSPIPTYRKWIVTMWHFGRDSLIQYDGKKFSITLENAQHILTRVYSKDFGIDTKVREEIQEYPRMTVVDAMEQKLNYNIEF